jgi:hypothetical protein
MSLTFEFRMDIDIAFAPGLSSTTKSDTDAAGGMGGVIPRPLIALDTMARSSQKPFRCKGCDVRGN